jgi:hypothetical protein
MKTFALIVAICLPLAILFSLARRKDIKNWQHYGVLTALTIYCSILLLGVSDHLASFGYGDAKVEFVNQKVEEAKKVLKKVEKLQAEIDFSSTVIEALNDSRTAFDKLRNIATDPDNPFSDKAKGEVTEIISRLSKGNTGMAWSHWDEGVDKGTITFEEAKKRFEASSGIDRLNWVSFIGANNRADDRGFTKGRRLQFLLKVICDDESLQNVLYAEYVFRLVAESKEVDSFPPFSHELYKKWWEENQAKYPEK